MTELNLNHPVTREAHDNWHKIAALILWRLGKKRFIITPDEVYKAFKEDLNITVRFSDEVGIELTLVDSKEADRLARQEGGLPI